MVIDGKIITLLTFPGVIVHELAHLLFCKLLKIRVYDVCYFRWNLFKISIQDVCCSGCDQAAGYVRHEIPNKAWKTIIINCGPFIINSLVGGLISMPLSIKRMYGNSNFLDYILLWLGISITMHAFPSKEDAGNVWRLIKGKQISFLTKVFAAPIAGFMYLLNVGSIGWLDFFYALALPYLMFQILVGIYVRFI